MSYYDISPIVDANFPLFPGETPFRTNSLLSYGKGDELVLSEVQLSPHVGAHADAPSHYHPEGDSIEMRSLWPYMGLCQVIRMSEPKGLRISLKDIQNIKIQAPRLLFATGSFDHSGPFREDFYAFEVELIQHLAKNGCRLLGIDTPSVDTASSKKLESHRKVYETDLCILENLKLDAVPAGLYQLIALPLPWRGVEASPVRAILLPEKCDLSRA